MAEETAPPLPADREDLEPRARNGRRPGDPYDVGFAKPPKTTRWKTGQSGNTRGRPPKRPDFVADVRAVLAEKITATVAGEPVEMTIQQALLERVREMGVGGDVWASKLIAGVLAKAPEPEIYDPPELATFKMELFLEKRPSLRARRSVPDE